MFYVLNSEPGFELSHRMNLASVIKTGVGLVSVETVNYALTGVNLLDGNHFMIPEGFHYSIGPKGEVMVLVDAKGRSSAAKLYDFSTQMDFQTAYALSEAQKISVAPMKAAYLGMGLLAFHNPGKVIPEVRWMRSKGHGKMGIFTFSGKIAKPSWYDPSKGDGSAVQSFEAGDSFFVNEVTQEIYVINKQAQQQWASANTGTPIDAEAMPKLTIADMEGLITLSCNSEAEAQMAAEQLAAEQRQQLGI